ESDDRLRRQLPVPGGGTRPPQAEGGSSAPAAGWIDRRNAGVPVRLRLGGISGDGGAALCRGHAAPRRSSAVCLRARTPHVAARVACGLGVPVADVLTAEQRSRCMSRNRSRDTTPEVRLRRALWAAGLRYRTRTDLRGKPDVVF